MSNPNKAKGTRWEHDVHVRLEEHGLLVQKPWQQGTDDVGDRWVGDLWVVQAKNYGDLATALREGLAGAQRQARAARRPFGLAAVKRRGLGAGKGYAAMELDEWASLALYIEDLRQQLREFSPFAEPGW